MNHAHGAVQWLAADVATTTYTVSGLAFQPKALRFYWQGLGSATDAASQTTHARRGIGFATGTAARRCVGAQDQDAAGTMVCTTGYRNDCVAMTLTSTPAADGLLDLDAITSDGFRLIVDDQAPVNVTVFWEAWGGEDLSVAAVVDIAEPAATGVVDYTVTGFTSDGVGQVVMLAGVQATGTSPAAARGDSGLCVGFATGTAAGENIVAVGNSDDASASSDTDSYCQTGECLAMITVAGGNPSARAQLTQWNTDGFRLNWIARATTNRRSIALAIKGGAWRAGDLTIDATSLSATATASGLPFQPIGLSLVSTYNTEQTAGASDTDDILCLGSGSSTSSRRAQGHWAENASGSSASNLVLEYDQVLACPTNAGALDGALDISAMNSDGFALIVDDASGVGTATTWVGYLAFGSVPAVVITPPVGGLGVVGQVASLVVNTILTPLAGALAAVGLASSLAVAVTPPVGTVALTGQAPSAVQSTVITPPVGAVWFGIEPPPTRTPNAGSLALTGAAPSLLHDTRLTPPVGALALTGQAPAQAITVTPSAGALVLTGQAPTVTEGQQGEITPPAGSLSLTGLAPPVATTSTPPAGTLALSGAAPVPVLGTILTPPAGSLALSGAPPTQALEIFLTPPVGALLLSGALPSQALTGTPPSGALAVTGYPPTVSDSSLSPTLIPPAGTLMLIGQAPTVVAPTLLTPPVGALTLTGQVPAVVIDRSIQPPAGGLVATGAVPSLLRGTVMEPPAGALALTGTGSTLAFDIRPGAGTLTLTGITPTVELGFPSVHALAGFISPSRVLGFLTREEPFGFESPTRELGFISPERPT